ncbi:hypothetical protein BHE74_00057550 [Ensete ventricosum]|nr:hypothetical protein BHE74_00057550 [Ensete ventricosum]
MGAPTFRATTATGEMGIWWPAATVGATEGEEERKSNMGRDGPRWWQGGETATTGEMGNSEVAGSRYDDDSSDDGIDDDGSDDDVDNDGDGDNDDKRSSYEITAGMLRIVPLVPIDRTPKGSIVEEEGGKGDNRSLRGDRVS